MMGAIRAEAVAADVRSAASLRPRLEVFHCTTFPGSSRPLLTEGTGIWGPDDGLWTELVVTCLEVSLS